MESCSAPRGLIVELVTPITREGHIDPGGVERLLARVSSFVQGVFLASPRAGDGCFLPTDLRMDLLQRAAFCLQDIPLPIFVWVTQQSEEKTRETLKAVGEFGGKKGIRGGLFAVDTPLYYHSNRGLPDLYRELCATAEVPIVLHNDPDLIQGLATPFKRNNIRTAILKELCELEGISGLIFSGPLERANHYQKACRQQPDFRIYDGDEISFLDHPSRSGVVSPGANLSPAAWGRIVKSSLGISADGADYPDSLRQTWETGQTLRQMRDLYGEAPAEVIKDFLAEMGILNPLLHPAVPIETTRRGLRELMARLR